MQSFVLSELLLVSRRERKAQKFRFHPQTTIVRGENDTGKSSLLKSIYRCFGAEPQVVHSLWKEARVQALATFSIDGTTYKLHQDQNFYSIYDEQGKLLQSFQSVTSGLGPYLASLFRFQLKLPSRQNEPVTPPPAFLFLPFYIDQDKSWSAPWDAFARLSQFANWRRDLAEYHTGIKPNEYYRAKGEHEELREKLVPLTTRRDTLRAVLRELEEKLQVASFGLDIEQYRQEITQLLVACETMRKREEEIKERLVALYNAKTVVEAQIAIARSTMGELRKDYDYVSSRVAEDHIDCPTCGASYTNSFLERFAIAQDEDRCHELLAELDTENSDLQKRIAEESKSFGRTSSERVRVTDLLATRQGEVELKDLIESEGRKEVQRILKSDILSTEFEMNRLTSEIERLHEEMQSFTNKERTQNITEQFRKLMYEYLRELNVETLQTDKLHVYSKVMEQGSDLPRALLAYYFAILQVMTTHSTSTFCPIVVDSPNQQDQDSTNIVKMLNFIRDRRPQNSQLILGLVDTFGVDFDGEVIELNDKHSLLSRESYDDLSAELNQLVARE